MLAGQVVVTEGSHSSFVSWSIAKATDSWATHAFVITDPQYEAAVESTFPRVKAFNYNERFEKLEKENRAYAVLDLLALTDEQRQQVADKAESYIGRWYDVGQLFVYLLMGKFISDGAGTLVCSRLITSAFMDIGIDIFPNEVLYEKIGMNSKRFENLTRGYATPVDLLASSLQLISFKPSTTIGSLEEFIGDQTW